MFTFTASIGRPKVSASTIAITVRVPVPRSCDPIAASTVPSGCTFTWQFDAWPRPPQVWIERPSPRRTVPVAAPRGFQFSFQPISSAAISSSSS